MNDISRMLRERIHRSPFLFHAARTVRFAAMVGPARPLAISAARILRRPAGPPSTETSIFADFDPAAASRRLIREGFAPGLMLPASHVAEIREQLERSNLSRSDDPHLTWPAVAAVARDPALLEVARGYFGAEPILFASVLWWSGPSRAIEHQHRFHFDVADVRSMTAFFYLTDVDAKSGPHCIIHGTHQPKRLGECARIYLSDSEAERLYGGSIEVLTGPSGTGFVEELTAYHKAIPGATRRRLMLGITYTIARKP